MRKVILFVALLLFCSSFVLAGIPTTPQAFYGNVYYSDGNLILENLEMRVEMGEYENSCSLINGVYDLVVESGDDEGMVYFYIQGLTDSIGSYDFASFEITELDFATSLVNPNQDVTPVSPPPSSSGGSSGGGGGGSNTKDDDEVVIVLTEQEEDEDTEVIDEPEVLSEQTSGTGLGAVIGFAKTNVGIGLAFGLIILAEGIFVFITQKKKGKSNEKILDSSIGDTSD